MLFFMFTFPIIKILKKIYPDDILKYSGTRDISPVESLEPEIFMLTSSKQKLV